MNKSRITRILTLTAMAAGLYFVASPGVASAAPSPGGTIKNKGGNFGLGLTLGDHFMLSGKYFMAPEHALQFGLGTDLWAYGAAFRMNLDYVWHPGVFVRHPEFDFMPYVGLGIGGGVGPSRGYYYNNGYCGPNGRDCYYGDGYYRGRPSGSLFFRTPILGLTFHWKKVPMDTFFEGSFQHGVGFIPCDPEFCGRRAFWWPAGDIVIGARYYF